ncbi:44654_t:CDS:2 [Gigaspora margarita]|uniref:44654_t:CDS:1 n=1 Tax=Gigaspora margarita TaxID=4874 RepID=A0ABN7UAP3_GIGMA|nr:44654_t:CDS:2 [Gigaspora margarita]
MTGNIITFLKLSQRKAIFSSPFPKVDFSPLLQLNPEVTKFAFAYHTNNFEWRSIKICGESIISFYIAKFIDCFQNRLLRYRELLKSIMLSDKVLACYTIYLDIHIDNRMCAYLIDKDHANSFNVWVYGYQKSFGGLLCEQFIESLI